MITAKGQKLLFFGQTASEKEVNTFFEQIPSDTRRQMLEVYAKYSNQQIKNANCNLEYEKYQKVQLIQY